MDVETQIRSATGQTGLNLKRIAKVVAKALGVTVALVIGRATAGMTFGTWAVWAGFLVLTAGLAAVARPLRRVGLGSRWRGVAAALAGAYLALFGGIGEVSRDHPAATAAVEQMVERGPGPRGERQIVERQAPFDRGAEQRRLAEERLRAREAQQQAAEETQRRAELAELEERTAALNPTDSQSNARHFERLAALAPNNAEYTRKRDDYARRVRDEAERAEWLRQARLWPERHVTIQRFSWQVGGFGTVFVGTFTIKNPLPFPVKDLRLRCVLTAPSGTQVDSMGETLFERLEPNQTRTFRGVNLGFVRDQAYSASCAVTGAIAL